MITHVFRLELLVVSSNNKFLQFLEMAVQEFDVLQPQLLANDLEIPHGVHVSLYVSNVVVIERSCVKNRIMKKKKFPSSLILKVINSLSLSLCVHVLLSHVARQAS